MGKWSRRAFIGTGGLLGVGLFVGLGGNIYLSKNAKKFSGKGFANDGGLLNAWIHISPENKITFAVPRAEMGQGVYTSMPMLIAEELEVSMDDVHFMSPHPDPAYANTFLLNNKPRDVYGSLALMEKVAHLIPVVATGGSTSIKDGFDHLRLMGASARTMLIKAAAEKWGVAESDCIAENAHVINKKTKDKLTYGSLAASASQVKLGELPKLKAKKDWKIIGKRVKRLDIAEKVNGQAVYGLDVRPDNMLFAAMRHATYHDGVINAISNQAEIEAMPGVKKVVLLPDGIGAAVVADNTWRAKNASLMLEFDETGNNTLSSAEIDQQAESVIANNLIATPMDEGNAEDVLNAAENIIEAKYDVPYLAHACMEPINCTVLVNDESADVWCGHQGSSLMLDGVKRVTGLARENINVHMLFLGGGFGRRAEMDMVINAANVANEMKGIPIQLVYSREESMRHEMYRPVAKSHFRAKLKTDGGIEAWENKIALQSVLHSSIMRIMPIMAESPANDPSSSEGAIHLPYEMENAKVSFGQLELPIQVGNWRSVGGSQNGFFTESFIDECAYAAKIDPYEYRKKLIAKKPRFLAVLNKVAAMSNWSTPLGENRFRGIALHKSFGSIVGQVAEITKVGEKSFSIDKYYCVIDCGHVVNPDTVEAQMESGIMYGLTAALYGEITFKDGEVEQYNFPQYDIIRMAVAPKVDVHIMDVDAYPGGVGEPSTPPAAPTLTNALFAATGERVRKLPLKNLGYTFV